MTAIRTVCDLCGASDVQIRHALVRWKQPAFGEYSNEDRCVDVEACKRRVAEAGNEWPIVDPESVR